MKKPTIIRLQEFNESVVEPQSIFFSQLFNLIIIDQFENIWTNTSESRILSKPEDPTDELIRSDSGLKDRMKGFAKGEKREETFSNEYNVLEETQGERKTDRVMGPGSRLYSYTIPSKKAHNP